MRLITLTTDYGTRDHYVGAVKGVILGITQRVRIVDITHDIKPHDILHGAYVLRHLFPCFPSGTIHMAVVDPGVGSQRRIILGQYAGHFVVVPDNGLVTLLHREIQPEAVYVVENRRFFLAHLSATFHGRDIMAPVAAHLAMGVRPHEFGRLTDRLEMLAIPHRGERTATGFRGQVLHVDRFGNIVTNIRQEQLREREGSEWTVVINGMNIGALGTTYSDVAPGSPIALIGATGMLEVTVNRGSAAERYLSSGEAVIEVG